MERHPAVIEADLPEIYAYIARDNPAAAERLLDGVEATFVHLTDYPESGVLYPTRNRQMIDVRMLPVNGFQNYLVFYRIETEAVRVLYVIHGARYLPRLFRQQGRW